MSFFGELKRYLDADTLCRMYYCGDHEVFEFYKECDKDSLVSRREFSFLESLIRKKLAKGKTVSEIAGELEESEEHIQALISKMEV